MMFQGTTILMGGEDRNRNNQQFIKLFSSFQHVLTATIESFWLSVFIIYKIFTVINLRIGMSN